MRRKRNLYVRHDIISQIWVKNLPRWNPWHINKPKKRFHSINLKWTYKNIELLALVLFWLNTANIRYVRTGRLKVHAVKAWTILCLLHSRSLGGNRIRNKREEWLHAFFIIRTSIWKIYYLYYLQSFVWNRNSLLTTVPLVELPTI